MTVAIKRSNDEIIYLDAVLQFSRQYQSNVTENPISDGGKVADHVTKEFPLITVNGVVSDADFHTTRPMLTQEELTRYGLDKAQAVNTSPVDGTPIIGGNGINPLTRFLPESVTQFIGSTLPPVVYTEGDDRADTMTRLSLLVEEALLSIHESKEEVSLIVYEKRGNNDRVVRVIDKCVITSLAFDETPDSGSALYPNMTFKQIKKARLKKTSLSVNVSGSIQGKASPTNQKGKQLSNKTEVDVDGTTKGKDTDLTEKSSQLEETAPLNKVVDGVKNIGKRVGSAIFGGGE